MIIISSLCNVDQGSNNWFNAPNTIGGNSKIPLSFAPNEPFASSAFDQKPSTGPNIKTMKGVSGYVPKNNTLITDGTMEAPNGKIIDIKYQNNSIVPKGKVETYMRGNLPKYDKEELKKLQKLKQSNRKLFDSIIEGPNGKLKIQSTWKILPDGKAYLSTVKLIPVE